MARTKIIEFITSVGDGGAETLVKDYILMLDKTQFDVSVVVCFDVEHSANYRRLTENGIRVISINPGRNLFLRAYCKFFEERFFAYRFKKILKETGATVVHAHLEVLNVLKKIGNSLKGIRLFHTCHSLPEATYVGNEKSAAEYLIRNHDLRLIALHDKMAEELNAMFMVDNTMVIRNGIDFQRFQRSSPTKEEEREALGIPQDAFVIGHVGRFFDVKNHAFLAEVFREVYQRRDDAYLLMVGAGPTMEQTKQMLSEYGLENRFQILSNRTDVERILKAMDVFVFPSIYEGFAIAVLEAQVLGLRCVVSDGVPGATLMTKEASFLPLGDAKAWAERVLDENYVTENTGSLDLYDMNKEIKRLEQLYLGK